MTTTTTISSAIELGRAGLLSRSAARAILRQGYTLRDTVGAPDDAAAVALLADAYVTDLTRVSARNDAATLNDRAASPQACAEARDREARRAMLRRWLTGLDRDAYRALIDGIAGDRAASVA